MRWLAVAFAAVLLVLGPAGRPVIADENPQPDVGTGTTGDCVGTASGQAGGDCLGGEDCANPPPCDPYRVVDTFTVWTTGSPISVSSFSQGPVFIPVGSTTTFSVTAADSDHFQNKETRVNQTVDTNCNCVDDGGTYNVDLDSGDQNDGSLAITYSSSGVGSIDAHSGEYISSQIGAATISASADDSPDDTNRNDASSPAPNTVTVYNIGIEKIIIDGSNPENVGPKYIGLGGSVTLRAKPSGGTTFPSGNPVWSIAEKPESSNLSTTATGATASFTPDKSGQYKIHAQCGTSGADFTVVVVTLTISTKRWGTESYDTATTKIAAGGKGSDIHNAEVKIEVTPSIPGNPEMKVNLTGGTGYQPGSWWWSESRIKAKLALGGSTATADGDPVTRAATSVTGKLTSSNAIESTTITAEIPSLSLSVSKDLAMVIGDSDITGAGSDYNKWMDVGITRTLDNVSIDQHKLYIAITKVTLKEIDGTTHEVEATATSLTSYTTLDDYAVIGSSTSASESYFQATSTTNSPTVSAKLKIVDPRVIQYEITVADMSVAQK